MGLRFGLARMASALSTWALKTIFHRPAANFPGKMALYIDPHVIAHLRSRLSRGSIVVAGTNGKTTVTNLIADAIETSGMHAVCNRTGANLDSGVATALLQVKSGDWGVFESDELWLAKILPDLQADCVVLLNLFRDQLDRVGEIDRIQNSIVAALGSSPTTTLLYNADDPLCQAIAHRVDNPTLAFGIGEDFSSNEHDGAHHEATDCYMCQECSSMLEYEYRQYGQLGAYSCPHCGFSRALLDYAAKEVCTTSEGFSFRIEINEDKKRTRSFKPGQLKSEQLKARKNCKTTRIEAPYKGTYMIYNLLATCAAAHAANLSIEAVQRAIDAFDPQNGRLQSYTLDGRSVLLNLAKNPMGFNQNLSIMLADKSPKVIAFFVNDLEGDGRDVSWLWDVDFHKIAQAGEVMVFAGGRRKHDLQLALKYADVPATLIDSAADALAYSAAEAFHAQIYMIANYTALYQVKAELDDMQSHSQSCVSSIAPYKPNVEAVSSPSNDSRDFLKEQSSAQVFGSQASSSASQDVWGATLSSSVQPSVQVSLSKRPVQSPTSANERESTSVTERESTSVTERELIIAHLFPRLLDLYGDKGNVKVLEARCRWRDIPVRVVPVDHTNKDDLSSADIVFLGGGPNREQTLAFEGLLSMKDQLEAYIEDEGVVLAVSGGYQVLGRTWPLDRTSMVGLSLIGISTNVCIENGEVNRIVGDIVLKSALAERPLVGYEDHVGRTFLDRGLKPLGGVVASLGVGNNETDKADGVLYKNVVGTYLHGPFLAKNPEVADELIERALTRCARKLNQPKFNLSPLDDSIEVSANDFMCQRLGVK